MFFTATTLKQKIKIDNPSKLPITKRKHLNSSKEEGESEMVKMANLSDLTDVTLETEKAKPWFWEYPIILLLNSGNLFKLCTQIDIQMEKRISLAFHLRLSLP